MTKGIIAFFVWSFSLLTYTFKLNIKLLIIVFYCFPSTKAEKPSKRCVRYHKINHSFFVTISKMKCTWNDGNPLSTVKLIFFYKLSHLLPNHLRLRYDSWNQFVCCVKKRKPLLSSTHHYRPEPTTSHCERVLSGEQLKVTINYNLLWNVNYFIIINYILAAETIFY